MPRGRAPFRRSLIVSGGFLPKHFLHELSMIRLLLCRRQAEADAAAEQNELTTNIADANFGLIPEDGEGEGDLAAIGRRIQVPLLCLFALVIGKQLVIGQTFSDHLVALATLTAVALRGDAC